MSMIVGWASLRWLAISHSRAPALNSGSKFSLDPPADTRAASWTSINAIAANNSMRSSARTIVRSDIALIQLQRPATRLGGLVRSPTQNRCLCQCHIGSRQRNPEASVSFDGGLPLFDCFGGKTCGLPDPSCSGFHKCCHQKRSRNQLLADVVVHVISGESQRLLDRPLGRVGVAGLGATQRVLQEGFDKGYRGFRAPGVARSPVHRVPWPQRLRRMPSGARPAVRAQVRGRD